MFVICGGSTKTGQQVTMLQAIDSKLLTAKKETGRSVDCDSSLLSSAAQSPTILPLPSKTTQNTRL